MPSVHVTATREAVDQLLDGADGKEWWSTLRKTARGLTAGELVVQKHTSINIYDAYSFLNVCGMAKALDPNLLVTISSCLGFQPESEEQ